MKRYAPHLAVAAVVVGSACDTPPVSPPYETAGQPYYWYQDERIYLEPDYGTIVVVYDEGVPGASSLVTRVLDPFELAVAANRPMTQVDDHHVLTLDGDITSGAAAVAALRQQPGIAFVAPAYVVVEGGDTLLLVNELIVQFRDDATQASIDDLVETFDTRIVSRPANAYDTYLIAYPAGADPLVFAALMHEHPLVEWVDPNRIGSIYPAL